MQACHPPLVLVFDITLGAVAHHDDGKFVAACANIWRNVVFAREAIVGAVTDKLLVDVDQVHAVGCPEMQDDLAALPGAWHGETAAIDTCRVVLRQPRWWPVEGHRDIRVVRMVTDILHRPVGGHVDVAPR